MPAIHAVLKWDYPNKSIPIIITKCQDEIVIMYIACQNK